MLGIRERRGERFILGVRERHCQESVGTQFAGRLGRWELRMVVRMQTCQARIRILIAEELKGMEAAVTVLQALDQVVGKVPLLDD
jgi:hypothetical protein